MTSYTLHEYFAGIGTWSRAGHELGVTSTLMIEKAKAPQAVIQRDFPEAYHHADITDFKPFGPTPDITTVSFPCQDISNANSNAQGIGGARSGLWFTALEILRHYRPRRIIIENSPALRNRGLNHILAGLAELGYNAQWQSIQANAFGFPHQRRRLILVAYPHSIGRNDTPVFREEFTGTIRKETEGRKYLAGTLRGMDSLALLPETYAKFCALDDGLSRRVAAEEITMIGNAVAYPVAQYVMACVVNHLNEEQAQ